MRTDGVGRRMGRVWRCSVPVPHWIKPWPLVLQDGAWFGAGLRSRRESKPSQSLCAGAGNVKASARVPDRAGGTWLAEKIS